MIWHYLTPTNDQVSFEEERLPQLVQLGCVHAGTLLWHPGLDGWKPCTELKPELFAAGTSEDVSPMARATALASVRYHCRDCGAETLITGPNLKCWLCHRPLEGFQAAPRRQPPVLPTGPVPMPAPVQANWAERPQIKRSPLAPALVALALILVFLGVWLQSEGLGLLLGVCLTPGLILAIIESCKLSQDPYRKAGTPGWVRAMAIGVIVAVILPVLLAVAAIVAVLVICSGG